MSNTIIETFSRLAPQYDDPRNLDSCWGRAEQAIVKTIRLKPKYRVVTDIGCGTGRVLATLAARAPSSVKFIGVEPAENMRMRTKEKTRLYPNVEVVDGRFEHIPLPKNSVDYIFSNMSFHWTTDIQQSISELARVLRPDGEMNLIFIGRMNGREFIKKTSPIFLEHMGPALLLEAASMRNQLTRCEAMEVFEMAFKPPELSVEESYTTYYDSLQGHWGWWVRIEGQFLRLLPDQRRICEQSVRAALSELATEKGIPYTVHALHVRVCRPTGSRPA